MINKLTDAYWHQVVRGWRWLVAFPVIQLCAPVIGVYIDDPSKLVMPLLAALVLVGFFPIIWMIADYIFNKFVGLSEEEKEELKEMQRKIQASGVAGRIIALRRKEELSFYANYVLEHQEVKDIGLNQVEITFNKHLEDVPYYDGNDIPTSK